MAAVCGCNIYILNTFSGERVTLRGHSQKVQSVFWRWDDSVIVSCGMDGGCYEWSVTRTACISEYINRQSPAICCVTDTENRVYLATERSHVISQLQNGELLETFRVPFHITCLAIRASSLYVGGATGHIVVIQIPLCSESTVLSSFHAHSASICNLTVCDTQ